MDSPSPSVFEDAEESEAGGEKDVTIFGNPDSNATVQVVIRLRPPDPADDLSETFSFPENGNASLISIKDPLSRGRCEHTFQFNNIFLPKHKQDPIFSFVSQPLVDRVLNGYNSCIFAYGQTGSGKTHSIFGLGNGEDRGLLPRSIEYLFEQIETKQKEEQVGMYVTFLEVYMDQIRDLGKSYWKAHCKPFPKNPQQETELRTGAASVVRTGPGRIRPYSAQSIRGTPPPVLGERPWSATDKRPSSAHSQRPSSAHSQRPTSAQSQRSRGELDSAATVEGDLEIREAPNGQVYVQNLSLIPVKNIREVMDVVNQGLLQRATNETSMNPTSSRSHTVFTINLSQRHIRHHGADTTVSYFNLVDLAGSERLAKSKSEGKRFQEAVVINSSLSALGRVVLALASNPKNVQYVPYRDSKLTRILQSGLGGNSFTTLLCCINPSSEHYEENLNSLSFADRCKNVENRPIVNYLEPNEGVSKFKIRILKREIESLKHELALERNKPMGGQADLDNMSSRLSPTQASARESLHKEIKEKIEKIAQERLALENSQQKAREEKEAYQQEKFKMQAQERERVIELRTMREAKLNAEDTVKKMEVDNALRLKAQDEQMWNLLHAAEERAKMLIDKKDRLFLDLPGVLKDTKNVIRQTQDRYAKKFEETKQKHIDTTEAIKATHEQQIANIEKRYKYWLAENEKSFEEYAGDVKTLVEKKNQELKQFRSEIVGLYELIQQLTRIIHDMEIGTYPVSYKCNIKCVLLPVGVSRPKCLKNLKEEDFPRLFATLRDTKAKADKYMRLMNNYPTDATTVDMRGGHLENGYDALRPRIPGVVEIDGFENVRFEGKIEDSGYSSAGRIEGARPPTRFLDFDPTRFAMEFCRSAEANNESLLDNLPEDKLRSLACALKHRCRREYDIQAEKQKVRDEVMLELSGHSTIEYLRHLENEVERYRANAQREIDRSNKMKIALSAAHRIVC